MPKNAQQTNALTATSATADTLADSIAAFNTARTAANNAAAALTAAQSALDAAWTGYRNADSAFDGLMLVAPAGYTPPA